MDIIQDNTIFWEQVLPNFWVKSGGSLGAITAEREQQGQGSSAERRAIRVGVTDNIGKPFFNSHRIAAHSLLVLGSIGLVHRFIGESVAPFAK